MRAHPLYPVLAVFSALLLPAALSAATPRRPNSKRTQPAAATGYTEAAINAQTAAPLGPGSRGPAVLRAQVLLDRARFSPGEMDAHFGADMGLAVTGYQAAHELKPTGRLDAATWKALYSDTNPIVGPYTITLEDVKGPFEPIPASMEEQAKLTHLGYQSVQEGLAERFHIQPALLAQLNRGKDLTQAGQQILVPKVERERPREAVRVVVSKTKKTVTAFGPGDAVLAQYPATIGSTHDPLPIGDWKIVTVQQNPVFNYDPALFWNANPDDTKARIAAGPNNPVGVVWMGLSKEHYGIHGTPEPGLIGHTQSHGCIRLTNWDAEDLSHMVKRGTPALLEE